MVVVVIGVGVLNIWSAFISTIGVKTSTVYIVEVLALFGSWSVGVRFCICLYARICEKVGLEK